MNNAHYILCNLTSPFLIQFVLSYNWLFEYSAYYVLILLFILTYDLFCFHTTYCVTIILVIVTGYSDILLILFLNCWLFEHTTY